jgi:mRNA-degrading endonuclease RelE of RelBE toxin-antitoxin system
MVAIEHIVVTDKFEKDVKKIRDKKIKERIAKEVKIISQLLDSGKPLSYALKGERTVRIAPYRLIYKIDCNSLIILRFEHRGNVYD